MLRKRTALITGASRGIGAVTARLFATHGARVAVNHRDSAEAARGVVETICDQGGEAIAVQADVLESEQVTRMVSEVEAALGAIDILVLNAGVPMYAAPFVSDRWDDFAAKLTREVQAAFLCAQAVVPGMIQRQRGSVVVVSSTIARQPPPGLGAHAASKAALESFARSLAVELGPHGVRVNVVAPGLTRTDASKHVSESQHQAVAQLTPLRRNGTPEDVAGAILMLASDNTRFVTGGYIQVDGGLQQR